MRTSDTEPLEFRVPKMASGEVICSPIITTYQYRSIAGFPTFNVFRFQHSILLSV